MTKFAIGVTVTSAGKGRILIKAPYHPDFIRKIKEIPGRGWDFQQEGWSIPEAYESRACKLARDFFPPDDPNDWKDHASNIIASQVQGFLPKYFELIPIVIDEEDGSTTLSLRRPDAARLEEVNVVIEDDWYLRESIRDEDARLLAKHLQDRQAYWLGFELLPKLP